MINPFYFARRGLFRAISDLAPALSGRLLDVGCGVKPYRTLFSVTEYVGLDIDSELARKRNMADFFYDGSIFPFPDNSFDAILCNQVLEHVFNPDEFLGEIARVMKPGGRLLLTAPFVWDEHEQPFDFARYSTFGLKALLHRQGLEVIEHRKLGADASVLFQLLNAYIYKVGRRYPVPLRFIGSMLIAFLNTAGVVMSLVMPNNPDLYLDHVVLSRKAH